MNFEEYQTREFDEYVAFAATVRFILEKALEAAPGLPQPQAVQSRAKEPSRLKARLEEAGTLDTQALETDRRDLAGARLIFYTNTDVEKFLQSRIIFDNFEVEAEGVKIHHPTQENDAARYRATHYTVRLCEDRTNLPEYVKFAGLRCEIQIQTILNHAWSETSHDIIYKGPGSAGFGTEARTALEKRFENIMDKYLLPAGYEIQKAQAEYERLQQGRELFDRDLPRLLADAKDNNERYDLLCGLRDYAIPHYDDLSAAHDALREPLIQAAKASRSSSRVAIPTAFGELPGQTAADVSKVIVEIIDTMRYADVMNSLRALCEIFREEPDADVRKQIIEVVQRLSEYNMDAWKQVGPEVQWALLDELDSISPAEMAAIRPIAITVYQQAVESDVSGTRWTADAVTLSTGALPVSPQLKEIRTRAIDALFRLFLASNNDGERSGVLGALDSATRLPHQANYSNELLELTLQDGTKIVEFITANAGPLSFEVLQHIEHGFLWDYRHKAPLAAEGESRFNCKEAAAALIAAILEFRDAINADHDFVRYKVLVGYESIYPGHWEDPEYDYEGSDAYRKARADLFLDEITLPTEQAWLVFLERCASTNSNDMATFPVFAEFLLKLAKTKPDVADRFLLKATANLLNFLTAFLNGLAESGNVAIYQKHLDIELQGAQHLLSLARHLRLAVVTQPDFPAKVLAKAIDAADDVAVIEMLLWSMEHIDDAAAVKAMDLFRTALTYLNGKKDARWVRAAWFLPKTGVFFAKLENGDVQLLLENLFNIERIEYQAERILERVAERDLEAVWDYFGKRLETKEEAKTEVKFDAVPFRFHGLEKQLSKDPALAIAKGLAWFSQDARLFQYRAGRLLSNAFPSCTPEFSEALATLVDGGDDAATDFALAILPNYEGQEATHTTLKRIVARYPADARKLAQVRVCIDNTGVVSGELGYANALRARKALMEEWLDAAEPQVVEFAQAHIRELDVSIAAEQQRAEDRTALRRLEFPDDEPQEAGPAPSVEAADESQLKC